MSKTIVYIKIQEDNTAVESLYRGFSCRLMYLGKFEDSQRDNGEVLEVFSQHLYESNFWDEDGINVTMDTSEWFATDREAFEDALELASARGFYIANPSEFPRTET